MWVNVSSGALEQGGSTLTQQLVKISSSPASAPSRAS